MRAYNLGYICGLVFSLVVFGAIFFFMLKWTRKNRRVKCEYDERQLLVRGNAYKIAFFVVVILDFLYGLLGVTLDMVPTLPITTEAAMFIIALVGLVVQIVYCIWHDAYFSLNEQKPKVLIMFLVVGLLNFAVGFMNYHDGSIYTNGMLNGRSINLIIGIMFILIFVALLIRKVVPTSDEDEE